MPITLEPHPNEESWRFNWRKQIAAELEVGHWQPRTAGAGIATNGLNIGEANSSAPALYCPRYELSQFKRHHGLFTPGEPVYVTEKIHGTSARYVYHEGQMYCGSHNGWKLEFADYSHITMAYLVDAITKQRASREARLVAMGGDLTSWRDKVIPVNEKAALILSRVKDQQGKKNLWWRMLEYCGIERWCMDHPGHILFGEVFGLGIQKGYAYGATETKPLQFAAFDIMVAGKFMDANDFLHTIYSNACYDMPAVPCLSYNSPYSFDDIITLSDGDSTWPNTAHNRDGCVVRPMQDRCTGYGRRLVLKCVGATYSTQQQKDEPEESEVAA